MDTSDDPRPLVQRYYDIISSGELSRLDEVLAADLIGHAGAGPTFEDQTTNLKAWLAAFPDARVEVRDLIREDDRVSTWVTYHGTHDGEFAGVAPTGRATAIAGWDLVRVSGDKIVEMTSYCDLFTLMNQIGAMPTATPS